MVPPRHINHIPHEETTIAELLSNTYELRVGRGGLQIVFQEEPKAVSVEVHLGRLFKCLSHAWIEGSLDAGVRKRLASRSGRSRNPLVAAAQSETPWERAELSLNGRQGANR